MKKVLSIMAAAVILFAVGCEKSRDISDVNINCIDDEGTEEKAYLISPDKNKVLFQHITENTTGKNNITAFDIIYIKEHEIKHIDESESPQTGIDSCAWLNDRYVVFNFGKGTAMLYDLETGKAENICDEIFVHADDKAIFVEARDGSSCVHEIKYCFDENGDICVEENK